MGADAQVHWGILGRVVVDVRLIAQVEPVHPFMPAHVLGRRTPTDIHRAFNAVLAPVFDRFPAELPERVVAIQAVRREPLEVAEAERPETRRLREHPLRRAHPRAFPRDRPRVPGPLRQWLRPFNHGHPQPARKTAAQGPPSGVINRRPIDEHGLRHAGISAGALDVQVCLPPIPRIRRRPDQKRWAIRSDYQFHPRPVRKRRLERTGRLERVTQPQRNLAHFPGRHFPRRKSPPHDLVLLSQRLNKHPIPLQLSQRDRLLPAVSHVRIDRPRRRRELPHRLIDLLVTLRPFRRVPGISHVEGVVLPRQVRLGDYLDGQ